MPDDPAHDPLGEVLTTAEARWQRHAHLLDYQPDYRIRGPEDPFTPALEYAHHAHWLEYSSAHLRAYLEKRERPAPVEHPDAQNDAWAPEVAERSPEANARETLGRPTGRARGCQHV